MSARTEFCLGRRCSTRLVETLVCDYSVSIRRMKFHEREDKNTAGVLVLVWKECWRTPF
jgi:hypothetical protein